LNVSTKLERNKTIDEGNSEDLNEVAHYWDRFACV